MVDMAKNQTKLNLNSKYMSIRSVCERIKC